MPASCTVQNSSGPIGEDLSAVGNHLFNHFKNMITYIHSELDAGPEESSEVTEGYCPDRFWPRDLYRQTSGCELCPFEYDHVPLG